MTNKVRSESEERLINRLTFATFVVLGTIPAAIVVGLSVRLFDWVAG